MEKQISGTTRLLGVIGSPISHSKSPAMYNGGFSKLGLDYAYLAFDIKEEQVKEFVQTAKLLNMRGFNVTMPCKTETARLVDELSEAAQLIGAVNTVVNENGRLIGHNTDGVGFVRNLKEHGVEIKEKKITLLGGGGTGKSVLVQLVLDGAKQIEVFNRKGINVTKLEELKKKLNEKVPNCSIHIRNIEDGELLTKTIQEADILINATNVGMCPNENESVIKDTGAYREGLIVAEIIYNPMETKMMRDAKAAGVKTVIGGEGMLYWQGAEAFRLFTGQELPAH